MIESFDSDVITIDYRVRGFTKDVNGYKHFIDHEMNSIQNFINKKNIDKYNLIDMNIYQSNIFHTKMKINSLKLDDYLFELKEEKTKKLDKEINEIFYGINIP